MNNDRATVNRQSVCCQLSIVNLFVVNCQLSTLNSQLSTTHNTIYII
ncbi:MAG: hypothetical protein ACRC62_24345 [Microcoleus sp.]